MTYQEDMNRWQSRFDRDMNEMAVPWVISHKLVEKITSEGTMKPFYGATTVYRMSERDRTACKAARDRLFERHSKQIAGLAPDTYHLTVHALSNVYNVANDNALIRRSMEETEPRVIAAFREIARLYANRTIAMRALGISTAGKDIIGIKFVPASRNDYTLLIDLFDRMEAVYPLKELYVPHVSLGYHQIRHHTPEEVADLYETLRDINRDIDLTIELAVADMVYQHHYDMGDFRDVFDVRKFAGESFQRH